MPDGKHNDAGNPGRDYALPVPWAKPGIVLHQRVSPVGVKLLMILCHLD